MKHGLGLLLVAAALSSACGGGESSSPPTSPASSATAAANASGGTSARGTTTGATTAGATITGTISALGGACPAVTFQVEAKAIKTDAATTYGDKRCADVANGVRVSVTGATQADGSMLAKQVKFAPPPLPAPVMIEGTVGALAGACPTITFTVASKTFTTDSQTRFGDLGCAAVTNGARIAVQTQATSAGGVKVLYVKVIPPPPPPSPPPTMLGEVTAVTGSCPNLTITLGTKVASTSGATVFEGKTCADVKVGAKVGIYGTIPVGATVLVATKVVVR